MLVLTRKIGETIQIGEDIQLTVLRIKGNTIRIGIEAPASVRVRRGEIPPKPERVEMTLVFADEANESSYESWSVNSDGTIRGAGSLPRATASPDTSGATKKQAEPNERVEREVVQLADIVKRVRQTPLRSIQRAIGAE